MDLNREVLGVPLKYAVPLIGAVFVGAVVFILWRARSSAGTQQGVPSAPSTLSASGAQLAAAGVGPYYGGGGATPMGNVLNLPSPVWQFGTPPAGSNYVWKPTGTGTTTSTLSIRPWALGQPWFHANTAWLFGQNYQHVADVPTDSKLQVTGPPIQGPPAGDPEKTTTYYPVSRGGGTFLVNAADVGDISQDAASNIDANQVFPGAGGNPQSNPSAFPGFGPFSWQWSPLPQGWNATQYAQALSSALRSGGLTSGSTTQADLSGYSGGTGLSGTTVNAPPPVPAVPAG